MNKYDNPANRAHYCAHWPVLYYVVWRKHHRQSLPLAGDRERSS